MRLLVTYTCHPGKREAFLKRLQDEGIQAAVKAEEGCFCYDYFLPVSDDGNTVFLTEHWADADALAKHLQTEHMKRCGALKGEYVADTKVIRMKEI